MTSAVPPGKKAALCRYFMNSGVCAYGDECQFLHGHPNPGSMPNSFSGTPNGVPENPGMTDSLANSGDQYFNATFCSAPNSVQEFQQFSSGRPRPRSRNSMLGSLSQNAKPFVPTPANDQGIANDFAALNLAAANIPNKVPNDFSPKSGTNNSLSHSASTPSFSTYSNIISTANTITPTTSNHINHMIYSSNVSPSPSPGISPTNSPLMLRRTASPVTPLRQTTIPQKSANTIQENVGGTTYFYSPDDFSPQHQGVDMDGV
ncbi:hypothetical protein LOTGIDRAFT_153285 [Lottia gigantea]|uniref:C3H1-type domain-containing protein n=1 Tax=Lottia gigantea TaxID=225164 RepID=V4AF74_LOTGI|nr:hypothetical protein LOTGIDRAFT_153285 [Lottia gigantea]ESO93815.1 hypothetical protein LOTGIDRAFT_153285 [Lottia gigantea]